MLVKLTSTPRISYIGDAVEFIPAVTVVNQYSVPGNPLTRHWFDCGESRFTAQRGLQYKFTQRIVYRIENVVCTGSMVLMVDARLVLFNETTGYEVPSSIDVLQGFEARGAVQYGQLNGIFSFNANFKEGENELLIEGHQYTVKPQIEKEQSVGSPTCDLIIVDSVHDGEAAIRLNR